LFILGLGRLSRLRSLSAGDSSCARQTLRPARPIHRRLQASCQSPTNRLAVNAQIAGNRRNATAASLPPSTGPRHRRRPETCPSVSLRLRPPWSARLRFRLSSKPCPSQILALCSNDPSRVHDAAYVRRLPLSRCSGVGPRRLCPPLYYQTVNSSTFRSSRRIAESQATGPISFAPGRRRACACGVPFPTWATLKARGRTIRCSASRLGFSLPFCVSVSTRPPISKRAEEQSGARAWYGCGHGAVRLTFWRGHIAILAERKESRY
jgi:hypothetical protein